MAEDTSSSRKKAAPEKDDAPDADTSERSEATTTENDAKARARAERKAAIAAENAELTEEERQERARERTRARPMPRVVVRPMAQKAKTRKRHFGLILSFFLIVALPVAAVTWYVFERAADKYASDVGFTVRQEDDGGGMALTGLAQFAGAAGVSGALDSDILYEFIQSQELVRRVNESLDLWTHFSQHYEQDPLFALKPGGTIEDLHDFWGRVVHVDFDSNTGLIGLEVQAFSADFAQSLADQILQESQALVNDLNAQARADMLQAAEEDLATSVERLKTAREALVRFRTRTQIVDPEADIQNRMGVQNSLQQQLAQALIDYDLLVQQASQEDQRVVQAQRRIDVIRERLREERQNFASDQSYEGVEGYPTLIAEYESLAVDREFAEETYRAALAQRDAAVANATRQSRYLATYVLPTLPETAEYPRHGQIIFMATLFLTLGWALFVLMYYSIRDRG
ncbi:sugar transporter [Maritimibacter dapengensis]|uniref:Sugar transporter n=1 Tax=Maritimibacter dapengensis TaxID=2836868 RepID=A0ABS6T4R1_9RHOB|nr:sugar transporter [Maritimibacter dapengensis]MBV7380180.1 sugar transporter [Maritimibacter dapengensis]